MSRNAVSAYIPCYDREMHKISITNHKKIVLHNHSSVAIEAEYVQMALGGNCPHRCVWIKTLIETGRSIPGIAQANVQDVLDNLPEELRNFLHQLDIIGPSIHKCKDPRYLLRKSSRFVSKAANNVQYDWVNLDNPVYRFSKCNQAANELEVLLNQRGWPLSRRQVGVDEIELGVQSNFHGARLLIGCFGHSFIDTKEGPYFQFTRRANEYTLLENVFSEWRNGIQEVDMLMLADFFERGIVNWKY